MKNVVTCLVGKTFSGKDVICVQHPENEIYLIEWYRTFLDDEIVQAYAVFEYLQIRELRKYGHESPFLLSYENHALLIRKTFQKRAEFDLAKKFKLYTSIDIIRLGASIVTPEFRDI